MKRIKYPNGHTYKLKLSSFEAGLGGSDENIMPFKYAKETYNFNQIGGNLKTGIGFSAFLKYFCSPDYLEQFNEKFSELGKIEGVWHFKKYNQTLGKREDKLIFINDSLQTYYIDFATNNVAFNRVYSLAFTSKPVAVNYRLEGKDVIIFSSETDNMVVWDGENPAYSVLDAPKISSMALHYERLFVTVNGEKNSVWFSDDLDPTNWTVSLDEAGFIQMVDERGALQKVVSFNDYLYVFREQGISRITAYANQENFSVSHLFVSSSKIYRDSVCICGDRILFLASDGIYIFDGYETTKILPAISKKLEGLNNNTSYACYYNGKYYLACKFNFEENPAFQESETENNALFEIDVSKLTVNIARGVSVNFLSGIVSDFFTGVLAAVKSASGRTLVVIDNSGKLFGNVLSKCWQSTFSDMGYPSSKKIIRQIVLTSASPVDVIVKNEKDETRLHFSGGGVPEIKHLVKSGMRFSFRIESQSEQTEISNVEISVKVEE